ncbi:MAG: ankyrin repeat domain-containing protein [Gammaproteobacteria bacterium]
MGMRRLGVVIVAAFIAQNVAWAEGTLVEAIKGGDYSTVTTLLGQKADVNATEPDGTTALHWAVYQNNADLVAKLIKAGAKVNAANQYGATPMSEAAVAGNPAVIETLLKNGADPESPNGDGQTALMVLARTSNIGAAKVLLKHKANVNAVEQWRGQTALMWAAAQSQPEMMKLLVQHGAKVNARSVVNNWQRQVTAEPRAQARPAGGLTPLLYASRQGCLECVKTLVDSRADLNMADPEGVTPLIIAVTNFHFDVAAHLLKKGANPNKWDWWGRAPLYCAVDLNTLPHGGRPDRISLDDTTSLKMIELLLDAGANANAQLKLYPPYRALGPDRGADLLLTIGSTPLLRAAKAGDVPAIKLLLAHGANPNLGNIGDVTPVMAAAGLASNEIDTRGRFKTEAEAVESINLLVKAGADVNARAGENPGSRGESRLGQTALHGAALWGWNDVVKALVANGGDLNVKDAKGMTPLDSALGRAGGHGRGGNRIDVHDATAALIKELAAGGGEKRQL